MDNSVRFEHKGWLALVVGGSAAALVAVVVWWASSSGPGQRQTTPPTPEDELVEAAPPRNPTPPPMPLVDPSKGREGLGAGPTTRTARRPLHELFEHLAPAVPLLEAEGVGSGSGFLVKHDGKYLVVTNRHVIENATKGVTVHFLQGHGGEAEKRTTIPAAKVKVVAVHRTADLAVLDVSAASAEIDSLRIEPVRLAPPDHRPQVGEHAFAIGHPGGETLGLLTRSLSDGIVSAVGRKSEGSTFLQTTVPVNPGNSGGPLFDDDGRVVGVNTFVIRRSSGRDITLEALNFALEVGFVHEALKDPAKSLTERQMAGVLGNGAVEETPELVAALDAQVQPFLKAGYEYRNREKKRKAITFRLRAGHQQRFGLQLVAGRTFAVVAVAEGGEDIDLAVFALGEGRPIATDLDTDAHPRVTFRTEKTGKYLVVVLNQSTNNATVSLSTLRKSESAPTDRPPAVTMKDLVGDPARYLDTRFVIERVGISGEVKKANGHPGYHMKADIGGGEPTYNIGTLWYGFIISKMAGDQLLEAPSYPSKATVKMTCLLTKGSKQGGKGKRWHVFVEQLDFLDDKGKAVKTLK